MPVFYMQRQNDAGQMIGLADVIVEAKSETAARLHLTRHVAAEIIGAKKLAQLVMGGVKVEKAGAESEAAEAALRG